MSVTRDQNDADQRGTPNAGRLARAAGLAFGAALVVVGCGTDGPTSASDPGTRIYQANCASCHGDDLGGTSRGPSLLDPMYGPDQLSDAEFVDAIRNGVEESTWDFGPMPANGALTDTQIDSIIAVVRAGQLAAESTSP